MGESTATILAVEESGGTSNFLIPNGTFFVVLLIFLIVLAVISTWVVPPISKVLAEREAMLAKTAADNKRAAEQLAAAQADYDQAMKAARGEASSIRDEARAAGRKVVDESRAEASGEVSRELENAGRPIVAERLANHRTAATLGWNVVHPTGQPHPRDRRLRCRQFHREPLMSTFIGNLIGFAVIVWVAMKWVVPLVRKMMHNQQEAIRAALAESKSAADKLSNADQMHSRALEDAKSEAAKVTDEARADSTRIAEQLREQAVIDAERIKSQGEQQVQLLRQQTIRGLRHHLGAESADRAEEIVRGYVADPAARSSTVDRVLDELEAMAPSPAVLTVGATLNLRAASRDALAEMVKAFESVADGADAGTLDALGENLPAVAKLLIDEPALNKLLAQASDDPASKVALVDRLFDGKVDAATLGLLKTAVSQRWSTAANLIDAVEHVARLTLLVRAERDGQAEEVEDQLFRFGRVLDTEAQFSRLLSDHAVPTEHRVNLLKQVLAGSGGVNAAAAALLTQTVELLRGESADVAVSELAELAVARRGEVVAQVTAAAELNGEQSARLTELLSRIYGHPVSIQLNVDPAVLGGLLITVGDEVIDGSISSRLDAARAGLPD